MVTRSYQLATLTRAAAVSDFPALDSQRQAMRRAPTRYLALEGRAWLEFGGALAAWPWLRGIVREGGGDPVLVLPGWLAGDGSTLLLRRFLRSLGYFAHGWRLGRNLDPGPERARALVARLGEIAARHSRPVSLVGWSLGGVYARELARRRPELVRRVITLASPLRSPLADAVGGSFGQVLGPDRLRLRDARRPAIPLSALYSKTDGIVDWRSARLEKGPYQESIELPSSHCGMGHHPAALVVIADRLAEPVRGWRPYRPAGVTERLLGVRLPD